MSQGRNAGGLNIKAPIQIGGKKRIDSWVLVKKKITRSEKWSYEQETYIAFNRKLQEMEKKCPARKNQGRGKMQQKKEEKGKTTTKLPIKKVKCMRPGRK